MGHGKECGQKGEETEDIWSNEKRVNGLCMCVHTCVWWGKAREGRTAVRKKGPGWVRGEQALDVADGGGRGAGEDTRDPKQQTCQEMKGRIKGDSGSLLFGGEGVSQSGEAGATRGRAQGELQVRLQL